MKGVELNMVPSTGRGEPTCLDFSDKQEKVDAKFNAETAVWRKAYNCRDVWGEIFRGRQAVLLEKVDSLGLTTSARVLDFGCGAGFLSISLARRGFSVDAIDHASSVVEMAKLHMKRARLESRVRVDVGDVHKLPFPTSSFDLVVGLGVIMWLHNLRRALAELERVLKPGGFIVLGVNNSWSVYIRKLVDIPDLLRYGVIRTLAKIGSLQNARLKGAPERYYYSANRFCRYMHEAGFERVKYSGFGFGPFTWFGREVFPNAGVLVHLKLQRYSEGRFRFLGKFSSQLVFSATKH